MHQTALRSLVSVLDEVEGPGELLELLSPEFLGLALLVLEAQIADIRQLFEMVGDFCSAVEDVAELVGEEELDVLGGPSVADVESVFDFDAQ